MAIKDDADFESMRARLADLLPRLDERDRRVAMATEAKSWGRGGISAVHRATGASRTTIRRGMDELAEDEPTRPGRRVRAPGGNATKLSDPRSVTVGGPSCLIPASVARLTR